MRRLILALGLVLVGATTSHAQFTVYDAAVTYRNSLTAAVKELQLILQRQQHSELRRMAQRLSMFTTMLKYAVPDPPRWRTHDWENPEVFLFSRRYNAALNYGDASGQAYLGVTHPVLDAAGGLERLPPAARRQLSSRLATIDLTDASVIAATHDSGQLRYNGRRTLSAIDDLESDVTNDSLEQSATAVLDKISGAGLIGARQRQARIQLLNGLVEQMAIEAKRARDTEAGAMNMQLLTWRHGAAANRAFAAGTGDALSVWRQP